MPSRFYQTYFSTLEKVKKDTRESSIIVALNGVEASINNLEKDLKAIDTAPLNLEEILEVMKTNPEKSLSQINFEMREDARAEIIKLLARLTELKAELLGRRT
jgi:hypothetical protein